VIDYPEAGTILDSLTDHGIAWVNYHNVSPVRILLTRLLELWVRDSEQKSHVFKPQA
jgi:hypothetical protein